MNLIQKIFQNKDLIYNILSHSNYETMNNIFLTNKSASTIYHNQYLWQQKLSTCDIKLKSINYINEYKYINKSFKSATRKCNFLINLNYNFNLYLIHVGRIINIYDYHFYWVRTVDGLSYDDEPTYKIIYNGNFQLHLVYKLQHDFLSLHIENFDKPQFINFMTKISYHYKKEMKIYWKLHKI